jgi:hypothetical protein
MVVCFCRKLRFHPTEHTCLSFFIQILIKKTNVYRWLQFLIQSCESFAQVNTNKAKISSRKSDAGLLALSRTLYLQLIEIMAASDVFFLHSLRARVEQSKR